MKTKDIFDTIFLTAKSVLIISGAGLSKASGIPTFRDSVDGLWENHRVEDVAHKNADKALVAKFYQSRYEQYKKCQPNAAHYMCAALEKMKDVLHVTQNVDGLLKKAGCQNVIEIHGTMSEWYCSDCGCIHLHDDTYKCAACGSTNVRPKIVLFGEDLNYNHFTETVAFLKQKADAVVTIGSSGVVSPVAELTSMARNQGIPVIAINTEKPHNYHDFWVNGKCEEVLPRYIQSLK